MLSGDVMLGRAIDQVMPCSVDPRLYEPYLTDARQYIELAEARNGPIPRAVDPSYVWGDALDGLQPFSADVRIVNLENAITANGAPWPGKHIHYRMHPANVDVLQAARIDCCVLANNHVLDWGREGLADTLQVLDTAQIRRAGAGLDAAGAMAPAALPLRHGGRVRVVGMASVTSGVPPAWQAERGQSGLNLIRGDVSQTIDALRRALGTRQPGDIVVVSIHWGDNWGYVIPPWQRQLAHALIDAGLADIVHGHSSHHPKGIEYYRGRLVLYGCGDLINDYEGIRGHAAYRSDLRLLYFVGLDTRGTLRNLVLLPLRMVRFRLQAATAEESHWLLTTLNREGLQLGTRFTMDRQGLLVLEDLRFA